MSEPALVDLTLDNLDEHHLCCAISDPKHQPGVEAKRAWLRERIPEGLVFRKVDVRGKVFIEFAPAEVAWRPIDAPGWLTIHCLWVSGQHAKHGYARRLLDSAIADARRDGRHGLVVAAGKRKRPFLSDPRFLKHMGFEVVDTAGDYRLHALRLTDDGPTPRFTEAVHADTPDDTDRFLIQWTPQCPFSRWCADSAAERIRARGHTVEVQAVRDRAGAQAVASPLGTYGLLHQGVLVSHHPDTGKATERLLDKLES